MCSPDAWIKADQTGRLIFKDKIYPPLFFFSERLTNLEKPVVTLCTTKCNINTFYVLPTERISVFCISEQTASFAPCDINWPAFVNEPESVYWAVRTEFLSIIQVIVCLLNLFNVSHLKVATWDIFLHYEVVRLTVHRRLPPRTKYPSHFSQ